MTMFYDRDNILLNGKSHMPVKPDCRVPFVDIELKLPASKGHAFRRNVL